MKAPPSASWGANAIACRTPSSAPQRSCRSAATAAMWSGSLTSSSSTSGAGSPRRLAIRCVMRMPAAEAGQHDLRTLFLGATGDRERDRALGQNSGDEQALAV